MFEISRYQFLRKFCLSIFQIQFWSGPHVTYSGSGNSERTGYLQAQKKPRQNRQGWAVALLIAKLKVILLQLPQSVKVEIYFFFTPDFVIETRAKNNSCTGGSAPVVTRLSTPYEINACKHIPFKQRYAQFSSCSLRI